MLRFRSVGDHVSMFEGAQTRKQTGYIKLNMIDPVQLRIALLNCLMIGFLMLRLICCILVFSLCVSCGSIAVKDENSFIPTISINDNNSILLTKNIRAKGARELIPKLMDLIDQFANSPVKALAQTLQSWLEPIVRMWRFSKSNGITEGFHTKMEMMSRRAYGFRNFENYRLRVLANFERRSKVQGFFPFSLYLLNL